MNKVENFNKENLRNIRQEITNTLKTVSEKYGIEISLGNITYNEFEMKCAIKATVANENTNGKEMIFKRVCKLYGLEETDFGRQFKSNGKTFQIEAIEPKKNKYPIIAKCLTDGKRYKFDKDSVLIRLRQ